jgi:hypothetical protein
MDEARPPWSTNRPPGGRPLVVTKEALTPNSYGAEALRLSMHSTRGRVERCRATPMTGIRSAMQTATKSTS